ncbi:MAG: orotidine-5'-phosphate decarboxylase [Deltaproteobacteria bacterium]|nr:orotidine-5'-phosphate decarboxylase [Deltaproteobacteria bacterium]
MKELTEKELSARKRACLALDVPTVQDALDLTALLSDYVGLFKVGKQLHTAAGNENINIIKEIHDRGGNVFLDLKLHDTPNTVYEASRACTVPGVYMFNIHIAGGEAMCKKAVEGAREQAQASGIEAPKVIGVTVLTSLNGQDLSEQNLNITYNDLVMRRAELAVKWGLDGIVCPANKAGALEKQFGSHFLYVTPGISWAGKHGAGQKQLYTPDLAVRDCTNSILVLGSAITQSKDKRLTAYEILQVMAREL